MTHLLQIKKGKSAIEYYGADQVMYGTDYPCWEPEACLKLLAEIELSEADKRKIFHDNAVRILGLKTPGLSQAAE